MKKRFLCLLMTAVLCLSLLGTVTLSAGAVPAQDIVASGASRDPLPDGTVFVNNNWTPANLPQEYSVDGKVFTLSWGKNAFAVAQTAVDAAPKYGTVYLCPGALTASFTIKKSLTVLGAKYGLDPNVRGERENDLWTLNPDRGSHETMLAARIYLGANSSTVYEEAAEITVDGIMIGGKGDIYSYNGSEGMAQLHLKNLLLRDVAVTSSVLFLAPYQPSGFSNTYKRFVTIENMRVEGLTTAPALRLSADRADISGVYVDPDSTTTFLSDASASNGPDDEVVWNIHDNMFASPTGRGIYLNWDNPSSNSVSLSAGVAARTGIVNNVYRNIFVDNYAAEDSSSNCTISFRLKTENVYFNIENNAFYQTREPVAGHMSINGYCDYAQRKDFSDQIKVTNNRFIGKIDTAYYFKNNTSPADVSGNFILDDGAVSAMPLNANSSATETWHWLDAAMTVRSDSGDTPASVSAPAAINTAIATASQTLPDRTLFVNQSWTEGTLPANVTVKGKTVTLLWGVNAFSDVAAASDAAKRFDTLYLCPGTYSGVVFEKSLTILGAKYGIDPNVKSQNSTDPWARNADRGSDETILSGVYNLGVTASAVYADATHFTLDGITISGAGQLRSNNGLAGSAEITLKNIYIKNSTVSDKPVYLFPYWPKSHPNAYRRFVTVQNMRVEGQTKSEAIGCTAERLDLSGVYMDTSCTKALIVSASASNGPTTEAVWNIHDNYLAKQMTRSMYLNWDNPSANSVSLSAGVPTRSKAVTNVFHNYFAGTVDFRIKTQNVYLDFEGNTFDTTTTGNGGSIYGYTATKLDYSDQIIVQNNTFIDCSVPYYFKNTSVAVDISGNFVVSGDEIIAAPTPENCGAVQTWYWADTAMKQRNDDPVILQAPTSVSYKIEQPGTGKADGVVTVTLPAGHNAEDIYLFWGNAGGRLAGYTALSPFKVSGNVVRNRMRSGSIIPQGATKLLAYSFSKKDGMSETCAVLDLPENSAIDAEDLGELSFEFQSVGDIHVTRTNTTRYHHSEHLRAMCEDIERISPASVGIVNNGDTADRGADIDYEEFLKIMAEYDDLPTVYSGFGNHETFRYGLPPTSEDFSNIKQAYYDYLSSSIPLDASFSGGSRLSSLSFAFWKNGHKFIFLGIDVLHQNKLELNSTTLAWLKDQLDEDRDPTRPTFIIMHQQFDGVTEDGGEVQPATETALRAMLKDYPEVIMFNGHTHSNMYEELSYYQGDKYLPGGVFNCGSVGYVPRNLYRSRSDLNSSSVSSQGYYVYVYGDKVVIKGRDFLSGEWIASAQYVVDISDRGPDMTVKTVKAPYYGRTTASLIIADGEISGAVNCFLPTAHNATAVALYFANADTGIIGEQPFATCDVADQYTEQNLAVGFSEVTLPANADYILVYAYSDTLGWSANCDVVDLAEFADSGAAYADGNVSASGRIKSDKKIYRLGEPIYVTATMETDGDWVGMQLASVTSGSFLNYQLNVAGSNVPVDITDSTSLPSWGKFQQVTTGEWQIGWIPYTGATFQTAKTADNLITITIIDNGTPLALGRPEFPADLMFSLSMDNGTVERMISNPSKYKVLWQIGQERSENVLWDTDPDIHVLDYGIHYSPSYDTIVSYLNDVDHSEDLEKYSTSVATFAYASSEIGLSRIYASYSFLVRSIAPGKSRYGVAFIRYELNGEIYEDRSKIVGITTIPDGYIFGIGPLLESGDRLDD